MSPSTSVGLDLGTCQPGVDGKIAEAGVVQHDVCAWEQEGYWQGQCGGSLWGFSTSLLHFPLLLWACGFCAEPAKGLAQCSILMWYVQIVAPM